jgi:hypothetical protein
VLQRAQFKAAQGPEGPKVAHDDPEHVGPRRVHESQTGCTVSDRRAEILLKDQESCSSMRACRARWLSRDNARAALSNALTNSRQIQHHADNFGIRVTEQASGDSRAARLLQVIAQAGIGFRLARVWPGASKGYERSLKNSGGASRYCPICQQERAARGELRRAPRGRGERRVGPSTRMPRADPARADGHQPGGTAPTRGVRPEQVRGFMALNPSFARPVSASLAKQWGRVRGREQIETLTPRVVGARFEENELLSQQRVAAVTNRAVQARVQVRQRQLADQAEQTRTRAVAARTHQRLANGQRQHAGGRPRADAASQPANQGRAAMSAEHPRHDTPTPGQGQAPEEELPKHPFTQALETWEAWSMANTMRLALEKAREQGDQDTLATFERYPEWTQGPSALEALAANRELVNDLIGWRWQAIHEAREQGRGWREIGAALQVEGDEAKRDYLERLDQQRRISERDPGLARLLRYDPRWRELAEPNDTDRAELEGRALSYDDPGCPPDWPRDNGGRETGHER